MTDLKDKRAELVAQLLLLRPDIRRFLASMGHVDAQLDDEEQIVLAKTITSLPSFCAETGNFKSWTLGITSHVAKDAERSERRGAVLFAEADDVEEAAIEPGPSPERSAHMRDLFEKVILALAKMPESLLHVLLVASLEEESHEAEVVPPPAVAPPCVAPAPATMPAQGPQKTAVPAPSSAQPAHPPAKKPFKIELPRRVRRPVQ